HSIGADAGVPQKADHERAAFALYFCCICFVAYRVSVTKTSDNRTALNQSPCTGHASCGQGDSFSVFHAHLFSELNGDSVTSPQFWGSLTWLTICVVAFMVGGLIVASERWHGVFTGDTDLKKPQAMHARAAPRVGGLAVVAGSLAGLLVLGPSNMTLTWLWPVLFIAAMPVFVAGLLEDITKDVGSGKRLMAAFVSAAIAWWLLGGVSRVGIEWAD